MPTEAVDYGIVIIGIGLSILGGALAIGYATGTAMDAVARQPEAKKDIRTLLILGAALAEGLAFFGAVVGLLVIFTK